MRGDTGTPQSQSETHRWLTALPVAAMFLTRLPLRAPAAALAGAAVAFPLVGLLIGGLGGGAWALAWLAGLPPLAGALTAIAVTVAATGALHEDGLADMADGLAGGSAEDAIRIMRDSRIGGYGVLALIFSVGLRAAALAALAGPLAAVLAMAAAGALSRAALPPVMQALPAASGSGLAAAAGRPDGLDVGIGIGIALLIAIAGLGIGAGLAAAGAAAIAAAATAMLARRRLGGYTGDCLGAVQQAAETAALLAVAAVT